MGKAWEVNYDGLIGPSHNYGGLSDGNLASAKNDGLVSHPKEAALQGLEKMLMLVKAGLKQAVLPPLARPDADFLRQTGLQGSLSDMLQDAARISPKTLKVAYSASAMWAANAATVSPSADTIDGRLHLTVANLSTMLHRSIEGPQTQRNLMGAFPSDGPTEIHQELPHHPDFADEGAANHVRLCKEHGAQGVELFVFGREAGESTAGFPARQSRLASASIARAHKLRPELTVFARQSRKAIEAGAFHNDVVCVGTLDTLFFHEFAFEDTAQVLADLQKAAGDLFELKPVMVSDEDVPLGDAISSYLFNSQLLQWPGEDRLVLLAPTETRDTPSTAAFCERLVQGNGPIGRVQYVDVRQSMRNGGGPACLRLRVVMTEDEIAAAHQGLFLNEKKIHALQDAVSTHYRDRLVPADLADPAFARSCQKASQAILEILELSDSLV